MLHNKIRPFEVLSYAGVFASTVIGAGFATGQEIFQFFSAYGSKGIAATVVATAVFSYFGFLFMGTGFRYRLSDHKATVDFYFGRFGKTADFIIELFIYSIFSVLIAGVGALANECLGIPTAAGRIICGAIVLVFVIAGIDRKSEIIGILGLTVILFTFTVGLYGSVTGKETLDQADRFVSENTILRSSGSWLLSGFLYPCFNAVFMLFLSCKCGSSAISKAEAATGGICGGILLGSGIFVMNTGFLKNISRIYSVSIPSLVLASEIGKPMKIAFSVVIFTGICTSAVPMLINVAKSVVSDSSSGKFRLTAVLLSVLSQLLATTDFRTLINKVYPLSGYAGIAFILWCTLRGIIAGREAK